MIPTQKFGSNIYLTDQLNCSSEIKYDIKQNKNEKIDAISASFPFYLRLNQGFAEFIILMLSVNHNNGPIHGIMLFA
jgi:hypothetical protein